MTATLVVHEKAGDVVYSFDTLALLGERLVEIFQDAKEPAGVTMIVGSLDNSNELTVRVGS